LGAILRKTINIINKTVSQSHAEYLEKKVSNSAIDEMVIKPIPPCCSALIKVKIDRVKKNIVGISTSMRGTCE
jgi:hypothetical protein